MVAQIEYYPDAGSDSAKTFLCSIVLYKPILNYSNGGSLIPQGVSKGEMVGTFDSEACTISPQAVTICCLGRH